MGKCVSKHPSVVNLTESDFTTKGIKRKFSEISDCTPICEEDEEYCNSVTEDKNRKNAVSLILFKVRFVSGIHHFGSLDFGLDIFDFC